MQRWLIGLPAVLCACASAPPAAPSVPGEAPAPSGGTPALAWAASTPMSLTYETSDTVAMLMSAGGMDVRVNLSARTETAMDVAPASQGVRATIRVTSLDGIATNSAGPSIRVGAEDVPGPAEVTASPRGVVEIVQQPEMSANLRRILGPSDLYRRMFLRLPGREIARGVEWTDTIRVTEQQNGLTSNTTTVLRSVWSRDTVVAGRTLNVITSRASNEAQIAGTTDGVQLEQHLTGEGTAVTLWDPQRRVIVERTETGTASGSTDLPAMGVQGMPTSLQATHRMRLKAEG